MRVTLSLSRRCVGTHSAKGLFVPYLYLFKGGCEFRKLVCAVNHGPGEIEEKVVVQPGNSRMSKNQTQLVRSHGYVHLRPFDWN